MKKLTVTALVIAACFSSSVMARHNTHYDYARVVRVTPVYDYVSHRVPVETCRDSGHYYPSEHHSVVPTVVGGVLGGAAGYNIGSDKKGKRIGLVAGTIVGAHIGSHIGNADSHHRRPVHTCSVIYEVSHEEVLTGYDVVYRYHGHRYHTHTRHHPGKRIKIVINVHPDKGDRWGYKVKNAKNRGRHGKGH